MEVTVGEEDSTAVGEEDSTAAVEEVFMEVAEEVFMEVAEEVFMEVAVEVFTEVAEEVFTVVEASTPEATLGTAADTPLADIVAAATTAVAAAMAGVAEATVGAGGATVGAADIGDTAMDGAGDGDLASGGRIGVGDGDIRMAMATARGITRLTFMILTHTTVLQTIRRTIRILTTGTTILPRQIPARGPRPTRTDPQDPGDPRKREAQPTQTTLAATPRLLRQVGRFSPLTG
jgi:hypothetical protein